MARFVVVDDTIINQEHIVKVVTRKGQGLTVVHLTNHTVVEFDGWKAAAMQEWLRGHVQQWGADAGEQYAEVLENEAMASGDDL